MTNGQALTATLRKSYRIGPRTRITRDGMNLKAAMLESIQNAVQYPGYYGEERTRLSKAAYGTWISYVKHVEGYRIPGTLRFQIDQMSPYAFAGFLGQMVDSGVTNAGEGEAFFLQMARTVAA